MSLSFGRRSRCLAAPVRVYHGALPAVYAAALATHYPEFKPWNTTVYPAWIRAWSGVAPTSRQALFAVAGDFNGADGFVEETDFSRLGLRPAG